MNRLERLLHRLNLSPVADDVFAGSAGAGGIGSAGRLFGGLVVAQAFMAAARTSARFATPVPTSMCSPSG